MFFKHVPDSGRVWVSCETRTVIETRREIYRGVVYGSALRKEAAQVARALIPLVGLWLSSNAIAAYRFAVRFEFSRVIWRAWGMQRLPSDRSICSSSSSSPATSPDSASLSVYLRRRSVCAHSSDDTRTRHTWKAVAQVMLEFPMGDLEYRSPIPEISLLWMLPNILI